MSTLAKLTKQAAQLEHDKQYQKALALYARVFDEAAGAEEEVDVALFNRAGDLAMRLGDAERATQYYERAIDAYATGGLLNNAIAVCNKLLRIAPEHAATHYTLAVLHAKQGFRGDAKHHYVEYADRMHRAGRDDEALRALGEFAALCPPGDDVRGALVRHLSKGNRGAETTARLETMLASATPSAPAAPTAAATAAGQGAPAPSSAGEQDRVRDLVFLDVSNDAAEPEESAEPVAAVAGLEFTSVGFDAPAPSPAPAEDLELDLPVDVEPLPLETFEPMAGLEPLALDDLDLPEMVSLADAPLADAPLADAPRWESELPGELPPLSLAGWIGSATPAVVADAAPTPDLVQLDDWDDAESIAAVSLDDVSLDGTSLDDTSLDVSLDDLSLDDGSIGDVVQPLGTAPAARSEEFVDLGAWLRESEPTPTTRLTVDEAKPTGDEAADFERLLGAFKAGIARNVDADDHAIHYDLGVAFREMGLIDEAIAEFQRAARAPGEALRAREALAQCFLDRGSPELALSTLDRALQGNAVDVKGPVEEPSLLGVVYLLGEAHARLGQTESARACFERVVATDIEFRDAARRLTQLSAPSP